MREIGILLPVFSLPDEFGIGSFSKHARDFIDFLRDSGQRYWQILPIGPIEKAFSPYQPSSSFAMEPMLIDIRDLIERNLLKEEECESLKALDEDYVDYKTLIPIKTKLLKKACKRFQKDSEYEYFVDTQSHWLTVFAEFTGDKEYTYFTQFIAHRQWHEVKRYANGCGISIIGDLPIYVSPVGCDIWEDKRLFQMNEKGEVVNVAGCPGDAYAPDGQIWNNPLYDWDYHKETGYEWWTKRMKHALENFDVVRIDHFRGFDEYFSIPKGDKTAKRGKWRPGPGIELFRAMEEKLGKISVIAEDLGLMTETVRQLQIDSGYPGMKVMQFGFDGRPDNEYLPEQYPENSIAYTGTHDNPTVMEWLSDIPKDCRRLVASYLGLGEHEQDGAIARRFMESVARSRSRICIIPLQDHMYLGKEGRINTPSTTGGLNWRWRIKVPQFDAKLFFHVKEITDMTGRSRFQNH